MPASERTMLREGGDSYHRFRYMSRYWRLTRHLSRDHPLRPVLRRRDSGGGFVARLLCQAIGLDAAVHSPVTPRRTNSFVSLLFLIPSPLSIPTPPLFVPRCECLPERVISGILRGDSRLDGRYTPAYFSLSPHTITLVLAHPCSGPSTCTIQLFVEFMDSSRHRIVFPNPIPRSFPVSRRFRLPSTVLPVPLASWPHLAAFISLHICITFGKENYWEINLNK